MKSVDEILSGEQNENPPETPVEAPVEQQAEIPRDDKGRFASKAPEPSVEAEPEEVEAEAQPEETPKEETQPEKAPDQPNDWTYAAFRDEKDKRQKWQEKATAYERELAQYRQKEQETQQQVPDVFQDPEAYHSYWTNRQSEFEKRIKFENSMQIAHVQHGEAFEQAYQEATDRANRGDQSIAFLMQSPNPGQALVSWHKREQAAKEIGDDPSAYRERVRQEIEAELREKYEAEPQQAQPKPVMPSGLAARRSTGPRTGPSWGGPQPLADILAKR